MLIGLQKAFLREAVGCIGVAEHRQQHTVDAPLLGQDECVEVFKFRDCATGYLLHIRHFRCCNLFHGLTDTDDFSFQKFTFIAYLFRLGRFFRFFGQAL